MYSTGTLAKAGGGKGRGTKNCIARRDARTRAAGTWTWVASTGRAREAAEDWDLSSRKGRSSGCLIGRGEPERQLCWRSANMARFFCLARTRNAMRIKRHKNVTAAILELEGLFRSRGNVEKQLGGPEESKGVSLAKRSDAGGKRGGRALGVARFIVIRKRIFDDYSGICWKERGVGRNTELVSDGRQGDRCNKRAAAGRRDSDALQMRLRSTSSRIRFAAVISPSLTSDDPRRLCSSSRETLAGPCVFSSPAVANANTGVPRSSPFPDELIVLSLPRCDLSLVPAGPAHVPVSSQGAPRSDAAVTAASRRRGRARAPEHQ